MLVERPACGAARLAQQCDKQMSGRSLLDAHTLGDGPSPIDSLCERRLPFLRRRAGGTQEALGGQLPRAQQICRRAGSGAQSSEEMSRRRSLPPASRQILGQFAKSQQLGL